MPKRLAPIVCGVIMMLVMITVIPACANKPEPEYAAPIIEDILLAINENDYAKCSEHFTEVMKNITTEAIFTKHNTVIKETIGDYVSKEFWKAEERGLLTIVYYKAKFTLEPEDVIVKVVFQKIGGKEHVAELWFDSPKLGGK